MNVIDETWFHYHNECFEQCSVLPMYPADNLQLYEVYCTSFYDNYQKPKETSRVLSTSQTKCVIDVGSRVTCVVL